ncbi:MAG: HU family DNA-binding protein [Pseudomonadota bacterium]
MATRSATSDTTKPASSKTTGTSKSKSDTSVASAKPAASSGVPAPELAVVTEVTAAVTDPELKKRELLEMVSERAEVPRNKAKPVVEAMIEILGETIAEGRDLNLQPLGKIKVQRTKDLGNARVIVTKIRQSKRTPE